MGLSYTEARRAAEIAQRQDRCRGGMDNFYAVPKGGEWQVANDTDLSNLERAVAGYWREIMTPSLISRSHITLRHLESIWGCDKVCWELEKYYEAERADKEHA